MSDPIHKIETTDRMKKHISMNIKKQDRRTHFVCQNPSNEAKQKKDNIETKLVRKRRQQTTQKVQEFFKSDIGSKFNANPDCQRVPWDFKPMRDKMVQLNFGRKIVFFTDMNYEFVPVQENIVEIQCFAVNDDFASDMKHAYVKHGDKKVVSKVNTKHVNFEGKLAQTVYLVAKDDKLELLDEQQWQEQRGALISKPKKARKRNDRKKNDDDDDN